MRWSVVFSTSQLLSEQWFGFIYGPPAYLSSNDSVLNRLCPGVFLYERRARSLRFSETYDSADPTLLGLFLSGRDMRI
jgi:hypothetical protein